MSEPRACCAPTVQATCCEPSAKEAAAFAKMLAEATQDGGTRREALEDLFWAVLTSREFVFNR